MKSSAMLKSTVVVSMMALLVACGGKTTVESDLGLKGAPDWVNEGTNILNDKKGRLFHGVGSAPAMGDMSLQKSTAENRARSEVARILSSYITAVSKDYVASATAGGETVTESSISRDIENVTKLNLSGVKIIGNWRDKKSNTIWSIAELDMKYMKETLKNTQTMNEGFKNFLDKNGDNVFDKMAK